MRGLINHIDLTVLDPDRSLPFYRCASAHERGYDFDREAPDGLFTSVGIMRAQGEGRTRRHDHYSPGLHHLAFTAESRSDVDTFHLLLLDIGAEILDPPADCPQYRAGYYAVFFADPDGLKLEYVYRP